MSSSFKESAKGIEYIRTLIDDSEVYDRLKYGLITTDNLDGGLIIDGKVVPVVIVSDLSGSFLQSQHRHVSALGDTVIWDATTGRYVKILRIIVSIPKSCLLAVAGDLQIEFKENGTIFAGLKVYLPAVAHDDDQNQCFTLEFGPNGFRCENFVDVICDLDTALAAGSLYITIMGWEIVP